MAPFHATLQMSADAKIRNETNVPLLFSTRMFTAVMSCLILFCSRALRMNMSVAILCMVNHTSVMIAEQHSFALTSGNATSTFPKQTSISTESLEKNNSHNDNSMSDDVILSDCDRDAASLDEEERENGPFQWTKQDQGLILSSFYWGYVPLIIPVSWTLTRFGSVKVVGILLALTSLATMAIPVVSLHGPVGVIVLRILIGSMAGAFDAGVKNVLSKWIPLSERARLASIPHCGTTLGTVVTFVSAGALCKYGFGDGWQSIFYVQGSFTLAVACVWFLVIHESPDSHPRISPTERKYIQSKTMMIDTGIKHRPAPWGKILTSLPVYAVCMTAIANDMFSAIHSLFLPIYFAEVMKFRIKTNSILSALPFAFQLASQIIVAFLSDALLERTSMTTGTIRKLIICSGKLLCVISLIAIGFVDCGYAVVALVLVALGYLGFGSVRAGHAVNAIDIAPQFPGTVTAFANVISNVLGLGSSLFTALMISQDSSRESWQVIFTITACVILAAGIFYLCFGSGEAQSWARSDIVTVPELKVHIPPQETEYDDEEEIDTGVTTLV